MSFYMQVQKVTTSSIRYFVFPLFPNAFITERGEISGLRCVAEHFNIVGCAIADVSYGRSMACM